MTIRNAIRFLLKCRRITLPALVLTHYSFLSQLIAEEPQAIRGPSTHLEPFVLTSQPDSKAISIISANAGEPLFGGYRMVGQSDGLGAYDNGDETFTVLMNHYMTWVPAGVGGFDIDTPYPARAHGGKGSFVSKWVINKPSHPESPWVVQSGEDLITSVQLWDKAALAYVAADNENFIVISSSTLAAPTAFLNEATGKGTTTRLYTTGEELPPFNFGPQSDRSDGGRAFAVAVDGPNAGTAFELPLFGNMPFENLVPSPHPQDLTVVLVQDDEDLDGRVYLYVGTKTAEGNDITKAGLTNGTLYGLVVEGKAQFPGESFGAGESVSFVALPDLTNLDYDERASMSVEAGLTTFADIEDGDWDRAIPNRFYFATNGSRHDDEVPTRLWRVTLKDIHDPTLGGTIDVVVDGTDPDLRTFDNIGVDYESNVLIQEDDDTFSDRLGKIWRYRASDGSIEEVAAHNPLYFTTQSEAFLSIDDEASGIIDASDTLGEGWYLLTSTAHVPGEGNLIAQLPNLISDPPIYSNSQLVAMFLPGESQEKAKESIHIERQGVNLNLDWAPVDGAASYLIEESADLVAWSLLKEVPALQDLETMILRQDDFTSDAISWNDLDTTGGQPHGPGQFVRDADQFILASTGVVEKPVMANNALLISEMKNTQNFRNGVLRIKVSLDTESTWAGGIIRFDLATQGYYSFELSTAFDIMALAFVESGEVGLLESVNIPIEAGQDWWLEGTAMGTQLTLKAWKDGDPEPVQPQLSVTDMRFRSGSIGLFANAFENPGVFRASFKEVGWSQIETTPSQSHSILISGSNKFYRLRPELVVE